jgi:phospholipid transport system transporter-binding protein
MLALPAELTHAQAPECSRRLAGALQGVDGELAVADASSLQRFDSSALAVLLQCRRDAQALGKRFAVAGLPPRLRELAALYGVEPLLPAPV